MSTLDQNMREVFTIAGKGFLGVTATFGAASIHFGKHDFAFLPLFGSITADDYHVFMGNVSITIGCIVGVLTAISLWKKLPKRRKQEVEIDDSKTEE